ncbi:polymorphic toxin type 22 domain-containing protein [Paraburkholderia bonniea]|uniref:polymorphic toxin type 22 domain-containing protein n=1 Tax=Paraburkholderia bonniea TaxID=2152891 RepID=UPI001291D381|nr:polymorphic toxin type 22 domain-containing protein [Paraburkholderia bonniea]
MRAASNSQYGESAAAGVVVPLNANTPTSAIYDATGMKLASDSTGNYLVQDPSMLVTPSKTLKNLITKNTGGASSPYSWGTSTAQAVMPKIDPYGPFSPTFNTGDYSAGFGTVGRGLAGDYATVNVGSLSGNVTGAVNLYDNSLYVGGSVVMANPSSIAFMPGISGTVGYIIGKNSAQGTRDFLAGDGMRGFVSIPTPFGFNAIGAVTHAYDGATAIEFGVGQPGSVSFGISPWGHIKQVTGKTQ